MDRRQFFVKAARLIGLPAALGAVAVTAKLTDPRLEQSKDRDTEKELRNALKDRLRETRPTVDILRAFYEAPTGTPMMYYQLFWPLFLKTDELEKVYALRDICAAQHPEKFPKRWHRIRVLPAVGAAHALSTTSGEESRDLQALIAQIHHDALDEDPNREALEIIWQNMTTALIRNYSNWCSFSAGTIITEAEEVCHRFLIAPPDDTILLYPASAAWQFLLTYECALNARGDSVTRRQVQAMRKRPATVKSPHFQWLGAIQNLYEGKISYSQMLPQQTEVVMGQPHARFPQAWELFALIRLQMLYNGYRVAEGSLASPYMRDAERAHEAAQGSLSFSIRYGLTADDWMRLKAWA